MLDKSAIIRESSADICEKINRKIKKVCQAICLCVTLCYPLSAFALLIYYTKSTKPACLPAGITRSNTKKECKKPFTSSVETSPNLTWISQKG
jgi:hypothetical protein